MLFMRSVERDRFRLLSIVCEGREKWRTVAGNIWRGLRVETDSLDAIFDYFTLQAAKPLDQRDLLAAKNNPAVWRDIVRRIMPDLEAQRENLRLHEKWMPR